MHTVRLSLFCTAALLVNGAYANEFSGSAGASIHTTEFVVPSHQAADAHIGSFAAGAGELQLETASPVRAADDSQWLRVSEPGDTDTANRASRPAGDTPRWVF